MRLYVKKFDFWKQLPPLAIIFVSSAFAISTSIRTNGNTRELIGINISNFINSQSEELSSSVGDWANWDETVEHVLSESSGFYKDNFNETTTYVTEFMLIRKGNGEYHSSATWNNVNSSISEVDNDLQKVVLNSSPSECGFSYATSVNDQNYLIASSPITRTDSQKVKFGCLYFGKKIDNSFGLSCQVYPSIKRQLGIRTVFIENEDSVRLKAIVNPFLNTFKVQVRDWNSRDGKSIFVTRLNVEAIQVIVQIILLVAILAAFSIIGIGSRKN